MNNFVSVIWWESKSAKYTGLKLFNKGYLFILNSYTQYIFNNE